MNELMKSIAADVKNATVKRTDRAELHFVKHVDIEVCVKSVDLTNGLVARMGGLYKSGVTEFDIDMPINYDYREETGEHRLHGTYVGVEVYTSTEDDGFKSFPERVIEAIANSIMGGIMADLTSEYEKSGITPVESEVVAEMINRFMPKLKEELNLSDKAEKMFMEQFKQDALPA